MFLKHELYFCRAPNAHRIGLNGGVLNSNEVNYTVAGVFVVSRHHQHMLKLLVFQNALKKHIELVKHFLTLSLNTNISQPYLSINDSRQPILEQQVCLKWSLNWPLKFIAMLFSEALNFYRVLVLLVKYSCKIMRLFSCLLTPVSMAIFHSTYFVLFSAPKLQQTELWRRLSQWYRSHQDIFRHGLFCSRTLGNITSGWRFELRRKHMHNQWLGEHCYR